ncbi:oligosaccharide flippase family protein [Thalassotalea fonticola]|uniref:Oligosaccharide flippase family protein n=1 Tax=Thalassotalea fonticola TaxID=3065649 RepID=A0ABZ0GT94_9GAMM|nr:oligosaccharide flippase family protein [Colwelliaceae bacterium S1-1]
MSERKQLSWSLIGSISNAILQVLQISILARMLSPSEFGYYAICTLVIGLGALFAQSGIGNAIIKQKTFTSNQACSVFWFNLFISIIIFIFICCLSYPIEIYFELEGLWSLILLSALAIPILSSARICKAVLQRNLKLNLIAKAEIISRIFGVIIAIFVAVNNGGVYAMIYGNIAWAISLFVLLRYFTWNDFKVNNGFRISDVQPLIRFSVIQLFELLLNYFSKNLDIIFITKVLGADAAGGYSVLKGLLFRVADVIYPALNSYFYPKMSSHQDDEKHLIDVYRRFFKLSLILITFSYLIVALNSVFIIDLLLGDNFHSVVNLVPLFCLWLAIRYSSATVSTLWLVKNKPEFGIYWNTFSLLLLSITIFLVSNGDLEVLIGAFVILHFCYFFISLLIERTLFSCEDHKVTSKINWFFCVLSLSVLIYHVIHVNLYYPIHVLFFSLLLAAVFTIGLWMKRHIFLEGEV